VVTPARLVSLLSGSLLTVVCAGCFVATDDPVDDEVGEQGTDTSSESETTGSESTDTTTEDTGEPCGNGMLDPGEECDDGAANADDAACTSACVSAVCGDGLVQAGSEDCDAAGESAECNDDCSAAACGDGKLNASAGEVCDGDVGMVSCADEGFVGGELICDPAVCDYDTTGCFVGDFTGTFGNCGQTGNTGPSQAQCDATYIGTSLEGHVVVSAGIQTWAAPFTATYTIEVWGAQGGNHNSGVGGNGAHMKGDFDLVQGDALQILVGQKGSDGTSFEVGGGGGTYVALADAPLIVAGGGGGAGNCGGYDLSLMIGKSMIGDGMGGTGSNDGEYCGCGGAGSPGGGFSTDGMPSGGDSFLNGGVGDDTERPGQCIDSGIGGFGGGGNGGNGGGGGGGYEGGDAGGEVGGIVGKGGKSYNDGANPTGEDGIKTGHGQVIITLVP
jgi:hypothetical protein